MRREEVVAAKHTLHSRGRDSRILGTSNEMKDKEVYRRSPDPEIAKH